ncbi:hypothetical protein LNP09_04835 [Apilactobacillus kunkeei]|uniref:hypothetical protein n=1 Tax=Apilactobacillus kunkeei TaxID=148814 RepID=UPI00200A0F52|nr:hypothetical protein [Apilactobacillus kunkeei]MCK8620284.1 hypothetical protein [Apilactobacillus kunkeei]
MSILVTEVASNYFHVIESVIPLITLLVTTPTNFLLSKYWVFRKTELKEASANE